MPCIYKIYDRAIKTRRIRLTLKFDVGNKNSVRFMGSKFITLSKVRRNIHCYYVNGEYNIKAWNLFAPSKKKYFFRNIMHREKNIPRPSRMKSSSFSEFLN